MKFRQNMGPNARMVITVLVGCST